MRTTMGWMAVVTGNALILTWRLALAEGLLKMDKRLE